MEALGGKLSLRGPGFLQFSEAQFALDDAARIYITESLKFFENGEELTENNFGEREFLYRQTDLSPVSRSH